MILVTAVQTFHLDRLVTKVPIKCRMNLVVLQLLYSPQRVSKVYLSGHLCYFVYTGIVMFIKPLSNLVEGVQLIHFYQSTPNGPN